MPNARVLKEKQKIVEELTEKLRSKAGVLVNYSGITVNEDTEMRVKMREANVEYTVVKNTLMRFAVKNVGFEELEPILNGTTSLALSYDDPVAPARIIKEYSEKHADYFDIKGGFMDGRVLSVDEVNTLASIPPLPILQAKLLGTMLAPIATLAMVIKMIAEKGGETVIAEIAPIDETPAPTEAETAIETPQEAIAEEAPEAPKAEEAAEAPPETPKTEEAAEAPTETPKAEEAAEAPPETPKAEEPAEAPPEMPKAEEAAEAAEAPEAPKAAKTAEASEAPEKPKASKAPKAQKEPKEPKEPKETADIPAEKSKKSSTAKAKAPVEELTPAEETTTDDTASAE